MRRVATAERDVERLLRDGIDPPDARLLHRFLHDRDESAFETLVDRHGPLVLSVCRRYLRDPRDVEDAFQATFLVLVRKGGDLRDRDALASWLYGVARRVALRARSNALTRRDREGGRSEILDESTVEPPPLVDDALETLDEELARLPEKYRAPLILCHLKGRTYDQAAAELGWPPGTVRSRTARARALLRGRLTRRGVNASATLPLLRLTPAVPASLVAATVAAVGRFPASPNGPVAALAQGVMTAMSLSSSKLLKIALGLFAGVSVVAGSIAFGGYLAQNGPERPKAEQTTKAPTAEVQDKPAVKANADEPRELEKKLDRIAELLARPSAALPLSTITSGSLDDLTFKAFDTGDVREIEAELLNAYPAYQAITDRYEGLGALVRRDTDPAVRAVAPKVKADLEVAVKPVRLLMARLLRMRGEQENLNRTLQQDKDRYNKLVSEFFTLVDRGNIDPSRLVRGLPQIEKPVEDARLSLGESLRVDLLRQEISLLLPHVRRLEVLREPMDRRAVDVERLIKWTREHFKEIPLTIDDAAADAK
ncbi:RNA polymerase sigma factor [Paludisphaera rhizosphaerae]|uniref:RNA polymerase sigma factor n=1 Tax=Paludisphaera rhizosphaerae TaxID=2711216 RepID=UPI0013EE06EA|nr:RNA polymerase sigma factor [Paludisphaera rhizosphaerae]